MKRKFTLKLLLWGVVLFFISGCDPTTTPSQEPVEPSTKLNLVITSTDITETSAKITVTPSIDTHSYKVAYLSKADYDNTMASEGITNYLSSKVTETKKGTLNFTMSSLTSDTEYVVFGIGVDAKSYNNSEIYIHKFTTVRSSVSPDFTIATSKITNIGATITITPSAEDAFYYSGVLRIDEIESIGGQSKIIEKVKSMLMSKSEGGSLEQTIMDHTHSGTSVIVYDTLLPKQKYRAFSFGLELDGTVTSELSITDEFETLMGTTFIHSNISNPDLKTIKATVTPSDDQTTYITIALNKIYRDTMTSDVHLYDRLRKEILYTIEMLDIDLATVLYKGERNTTTPYSFKDNEVYVVSVALDTDLKFLSGFSWSDLYTLTAAPEQTFQFTLSETTFNSTKATIKPSIGDESYVAVAIESSVYESFESETEITDYILTLVEEEDVVTGEQTLIFDNLTANTQYVIVAVGMDSELEVTSSHQISAKFTTTAEPTQTFEFVVSDIEYYNSKVKVTPSLVDESYVVVAISTQTYSELRGDVAVANHIKSLVQASDLMTGEQTKSIINLDSYTEYYIVAMGADASLNATSTPQLSDKFTTKENEVAITVGEIKEGVINYSTNATESNQDYFVWALTTSEVNSGIQTYGDLNSYLQSILMSQYSSLPESQQLLIYNGKVLNGSASSSQPYTIENLTYKLYAVNTKFDENKQSTVFSSEEFTTPKAVEAPLSRIDIGVAVNSETAVSVTTTPDNSTGRYFTSFMQAASYNSLSNSNQLESVMTQFVQNQINGASGATTTDKVHSITTAGAVTRNINGLTPGQTYRIFVVGIADDGTLSTSLFFSDEFTMDGELIAGTLDVEVDFYGSIFVSCDITPSNNNFRYYTTAIKQSEVSGLTDEQIISKIEQELTHLINEYSDTNTGFNYLTSQGRRVSSLPQTLAPNTQYRLYSIGVSYPVKATTALHKSESFTTHSSLNIQVSASDITETSMKLNVQASNSNDTYFIGLVTNSAYTSLSSSDLIEALLGPHREATKNMTDIQKESYYRNNVVRSGTSLSTVVSGLVTNTDYRILYFGVDVYGNVTTPSLSVSSIYRTTGLLDVDFGFTLNSVSQNLEANITVRPENSSIRYYTGIYEASVVSSVTDAKFAQYVIGQLENERIASGKTASVFYSEITHTGNISYNTAPLRAGVSYDIFAFGLDLNGTQTSDIVFKNPGLIIELYGQQARISQKANQRVATPARLDQNDIIIPKF